MRSVCTKSATTAQLEKLGVYHEFGLVKKRRDNISKENSGLRALDGHAYGLYSNLEVTSGSRKGSPPLKAVAMPAPTATKKRVFTFGKGKSEGNKSMKSLLGGKGANLAEMASIGLSVPPGLTISTEACQEYEENGHKLPNGLWEEILEGLHKVEQEMGAYLGDPAKPLLLSVRSGAAISMPGMMDTVLNLGLNDEVVAGLSEKSGERFAYDSYRRFLDMFGDVVRLLVSNRVYTFHMIVTWYYNK